MCALSHQACNLSFCSELRLDTISSDPSCGPAFSADSDGVDDDDDDGDADDEATEVEDAEEDEEVDAGDSFGRGIVGTGEADRPSRLLVKPSDSRSLENLRSATRSTYSRKL